MHPENDSCELEKPSENSYQYEEDNEELEARLYAEIYYTSETTDEIVKPRINTLDDLKNACMESNIQIAENTAIVSVAPIQTTENHQESQEASNIENPNNKNNKRKCKKKVQTPEDLYKNFNPQKHGNLYAKFVNKLKQQALKSKGQIKEKNKLRIRSTRRTINQEIISVEESSEKVPVNVHLYFNDDNSNEYTIETSSNLDPISSSNDNSQSNEQLNEPASIETEKISLTPQLPMVDLLTDSSKDSLFLEENVKYNVETKIEKVSKIQKKVDKSDQDSDSEESIFEVPVPPKPSPPIISLDDSDKDDSDNDNDDSGSSSSDSEPYLESSDSQNETIYVIEKLPNSMEPENAQSLKQAENIIDLTSNEIQIDNMILNCTEVQKGVSNLEEIRRLRNSVMKETQNTENISKRASFSASKKRSHDEIERTDENKLPCQLMIKKMQAFYNNSWGGENFEVQDIQSKMSKDSRRWAILDEDLRSDSLNTLSRYWGTRCKICQKTGHTKMNCPNAKNTVCCNMCGVEGHRETRCPHKMCLTCGKKQSTFRKTCENCRLLKCITCKSIGHEENSCPDLWRRYHHTTTNENVIVPQNLENVMKAAHLLSCCNCAKSGHDSSTCTKYRWSPHFPTPAFVSSYADNMSLFRSVQVPNPFSRNIRDNFNNYVSRREVISPDSYLERMPPPSRVPDPQSKMPNPMASLNALKSPQKSNQIILSLFEYNEAMGKRFELPLKIVRPEVTQGIMSKNVELIFLKTLRSFVPFSMQIIWNEVDGLALHVQCKKNLGDIIKSVINLWAQRTYEEQKNMIILPPEKEIIIKLLTEKFSEYNTLIEKPDVLYNDILRLKNTLQNYYGLNNTKDYQILLEQYFEQQARLVMSLYKYNCINNSSGKIQNINNLLMASKRTIKPIVDSTIYLQVIFHVNSMFTPYVPKDLGKMIDKYVGKGRQGLPQSSLNHPPSLLDLKITPVERHIQNSGLPFCGDFSDNYLTASMWRNQFDLPFCGNPKDSFRPRPRLVVGSNMNSPKRLPPENSPRNNNPRFSSPGNNVLRPFRGINPIESFHNCPRENKFLSAPQQIEPPVAPFYRNPVQDSPRRTGKKNVDVQRSLSSGNFVDDIAGSSTPQNNSFEKKDSSQQNNAKIQKTMTNSQKQTFKNAMIAVQKAIKMNMPGLAKEIKVLRTKMKKPMKLRKKDVKMLNKKMYVLMAKKKDKEKPL